MRWLPLLAAAALLSGVAQAQVQSTENSAPQGRHEKLGGDPNRLICHTDEVTGSRLESHKTCLTAAQWEDQRRQNSQTIGQMQATRCRPGTGC